MRGPNDQPPERFADDPESEAGALVRRVPEPAPWSAQRKARVREGIDARLERPRRTLAWPAVAAACLVAGLVVGRALRPRPAVAPPVAVAAASAPAPRVVAHGHAELRDGRVVLHEGRVVVEARREPVLVEVPGGGARVRASGGAVVDVRLSQWRVQVSTYRGSAEVELRDFGPRTLAAGRTLDEDGERAIAAALSQEIAAALAALAATPEPARAAEPAAEPPAPGPVVRAAPPRRTPAPQPSRPAGEEPPAPAEPAPAEPPPVEPPPVAAIEPPAPAPVKLPVDEEPAAAPTAPPAKPAPSALARETETLRRAVQRLRHDRDPAGALALLDAYLREHPRGVLRGDAEVARVDALLQLGARADALASLERLRLDGLPRARELQVTRGELRAEARRFGAAIADLSAAADGSDQLAERALFRRAACHASGGDAAAARADLEAYLRRFPDGRFAAEARAALASR